MLLVDFVKPPFGRVVDLCSGVGVVGLGLLIRDAAATGTLVELQPRLAGLAQRNVAGNALGERARVVVGDVAAGAPLPGASCELATANPPYRLPADGPASPDAEVAIAQHELKLTLPQLAAELRRLLVPGGRAALVHTAARLGEILGALDDAGLRPRRLCCVHPRAGAPANRVLIEAHKSARGPLVIEPPLMVRDGDGYSAEAARLLGDGDGDGEPPAG